MPTVTNNNSTIKWEFDPENKTIVYMDIQQYNKNNIKELFDLMHKTLQELVYVGVKLVRQSVVKQDWAMTISKSKTTWKIHKKLLNIPYKTKYHLEFMDIYVLECMIDDFLDNVRKGFGIK